MFALQLAVKKNTSETFILGSYLTYSCKWSTLSEIQSQDFHVSSLLLEKIQLTGLWKPQKFKK